MDENESMDFNAYKKHMNEYLNRYYPPEYFGNMYKNAKNNAEKTMEGYGYTKTEHGDFEDKDGKWVPWPGNRQTTKRYFDELSEPQEKAAKVAEDEHNRIKHRFSENFIDTIPKRYHQGENTMDYLPRKMFLDWYDNDTRLQDELDKQKSITEGVKERW